jgi:hypothetical protein
MNAHQTSNPPKTPQWFGFNPAKIGACKKWENRQWFYSH